MQLLQMAFQSSNVKMMRFYSDLAYFQYICTFKQYPGMSNVSTQLYQHLVLAGSHELLRAHSAKFPVLMQIPVYLPSSFPGDQETSERLHSRIMEVSEHSHWREATFMVLFSLERGRHKNMKPKPC